MDLLKMIAELRDEKAAVDDAIAVLERLAQTTTRRRGRPPAWMRVIQGENNEPRAPRVFSADTRKRMAEAQKKRWAAYRKTKQVPESK